jgi:hypothetical protein
MKNGEIQTVPKLLCLVLEMNDFVRVKVRYDKPWHKNIWEIEMGK